MSSFLLGQTGKATSSTSNIKIIQKYEEWRTKQYKLGKYETPEKCNPDYSNKENYNGPGIGISSDINVYYTDLNNDNIMDAIVCFEPLNCYGGSANMGQGRVIIYSKGTQYLVDDKLIDDIENNLVSGRIFITRASYGVFYGEFVDYLKDDPNCCPSIRKAIQITFSDKKLHY